MSLKSDVFEYLCAHSDEYVSGETLAQKFNKSRAAVWKAIKTLQNDGVRIQAVTNRGYKLLAENDIFNAEAVKNRLDFDCRVVYFDSVDSTNTQAKRMINDGANDVFLVVAAEQTAGRGRQGKSFYSPANTGIYMSLVVHPNTLIQNAVGITTASCVAVCRAIEKITDVKPSVKWVNDVYVGDKKICGILTEAVTDFETQIVSSVVVGIGVNISTEDFPDGVENASSLNVDVKRAELTAAVANELNRIIYADFSEYIDYYREHSMLIGKDIFYVKNGEKVFAKATAIDSDGGLEVLLENGEKTVLRSGEITVRRV